MKIKILLLLFAASLSLGAYYPNAKVPDGKIHIVETYGEVKFTSNGKPTEVKSRGTYIAAGNRIVTNKDSYQTLVYSNAVGMYVDASTDVRIESFIQSPFKRAHAGMTNEPSVSQSKTFLVKGTIAICTAKMSDLSEIEYATPNASVDIYQGRMVLIADRDGTRVYLLEGHAIVKSITGPSRGDGDYMFEKSGEVIALDPVGKMTRRAMTDDEFNNMLEKITIACTARTSVYFDMDEKNNDIIAIPTISTGPIQAVSPATITK